MALKRRQIAIILSVVYLGTLTAIAAYASHSSSLNLLPIPNAQTALTLALPPLAGLTIEFSNALGTALAGSPKHRQADLSVIPPVLVPGTIALAVLLVYQAVMATLAGIRIAPGRVLDWELRERWSGLWRDGDGRLAGVQERFGCCGFGEGEMRVGGCTGTQGCLEPWRGEERLVGALMLVVAIGTFLWMAVVTATPVAQPKVLRKVLQPSTQPLVAEGEEGEYRDEEDEGEEASVRREIAALNSQSDLARWVESNRSRPSKLNNEAGRWERD